MIWLFLTPLFLPLWVIKTMTCWIPGVRVITEHLFMLNEFVRMYGFFPHVNSAIGRVNMTLFQMEVQILRSEELSFVLMEQQREDKSRFYHSIKVAEHFKLHLK